MDAAKAAVDKAARRSEWLHDEDVPIATKVDKCICMSTVQQLQRLHLK
jgi:hypothetical protein